MAILNYLKAMPIMSLLEDIEPVVMDIGARGGLDENFLPAAWTSKIIGFEPEPKEFDRLQKNADPRWKSMIALPVAIGAQNGQSNLFIPVGKEGASLRPHNPEMVDLFGYESLHKTDKIINVETLTLNEAMVRFAIPQVDYLKIDVEGAELDILGEADLTLSKCSSVKVEASFLMQREKQPLAWDVMTFLHNKGFWLVDMIDCHRWRRRPVPAHPYVIKYDMPYSKGILAQCDLIFLKDFRKIDNDVQALRLSLVAFILGFIDYAVTVLRHFPEVNKNVKSRYGIDLEMEYAAIAKRIGKQECRNAIMQTVRGLVPLIRSYIGLLPYNKKVLHY